MRAGRNNLAVRDLMGLHLDCQPYGRVTLDIHSFLFFTPHAWWLAAWSQPWVWPWVWFGMGIFCTLGVRFAHRHLRGRLLALVLGVALPSVLIAANLITFTDGTQADADEVNANFSALNNELAAVQTELATLKLINSENIFGIASLAALIDELNASVALNSARIDALEGR